MGKKITSKNTDPLLERSADAGKYFKKEGLEDLSNVVDYAIKRSDP